LLSFAVAFALGKQAYGQGLMGREFDVDEIMKGLMDSGELDVKIEEGLAFARGLGKAGDAMLDPEWLSPELGGSAWWQCFG